MRVLKEGETCETLCAVYQLSTMVRTNLYDLGGGLPAWYPVLPDRMVFAVY
jgi:hypothetical protein